jgi:hypothetical protein
MSRQVALGGVIGFLLTVVFMAVCQKNEPAPPPPASGVTRVEHLEPATFGEPVKALPAAVLRHPPAGPLPSVVRPLNLEFWDAGRR